MIGHLLDSERIFAYRALRIARGDAMLLSGFDENAYVAAADFNRRSLRAFLQEFATVRAATLQRFRSLVVGAWERRGTANGIEVSVRAMSHIVAGHTEHPSASCGSATGWKAPEQGRSRIDDLP